MNLFYVPLLKRSSFSIRLHLLFLLLLAASLYGGYTAVFFISWGSAFCHELFHILAARAFQVGISGIDFLPFGICARLRQPLIKNPLHEIWIALAGPFCSFSMALLFFALPSVFPHPMLQYTACINLSLGLINLLPCLPLDGGRMLRALLTYASDPLTAWRLCRALSVLISSILVGFGVLYLLFEQFSFSYLMIGAFVLSNLCAEQTRMHKQALKELLDYKQKLDIACLNETRILTAHQSLPARKLLRRLSYHHYTAVQVVDENNHIVKTLTEGEILNALLNKSIRLLLGEI